MKTCKAVQGIKKLGEAWVEAEKKNPAYLLSRWSVPLHKNSLYVRCKCSDVPENCNFSNIPLLFEGKRIGKVIDNFDGEIIGEIKNKKIANMIKNNVIEDFSMGFECKINKEV
jgi:hypothetical protein